MSHLSFREGSQRVGQRPVPVLGGVLVAERCGRAGVPSAVHQLSSGRAGGRRPGQPGMTEVVKVEVRSTCRHSRALPGSVEGPRRQRQARFAREKPRILSRFHVLGQVKGEQGQNIVRDHDSSPAGVALRWADGVGAVRMDDEGPLYAEFPMQLVDVPALEPEDLAPPERHHTASRRARR